MTTGYNIIHTPKPRTKSHLGALLNPNGGKMFTKKKSKTVTCIGENLEHIDAIKKVLSKFAKDKDVDIVVSNPHGKPSETIYKQEVLHIRFWSCPVTGNVNKRNIYRTYGIELEGGQLDAMCYSDQGIEIKDDNGVTIAEYLPHTLFVHFDLPHGNNAAKLLTKILDSFSKIYTTNPEDLEKALTELKAKAEHKFIELCQGLTGLQKDVVQKKLADVDTEIKNVQNQIIKHTRSRKELQDQLIVIARLESSGDIIAYQDQFANLCEISVTGQVRVSNRTIVVPVGQIDITYNSKTYDIGQFDVVIHTNGENGGVTCISHTSQSSIKTSCYHPHVLSNGNCCLGNISQIITDLIAVGDYVNVVLIMTDFLRSYSPNNPYAKVENWPIKSST